MTPNGKNIVQLSDTLTATEENVNNTWTTLPLLHGATGIWDEVVIYGGIGLILITLLFLSRRASKERERKRRRRGGRT